MKKADISIIVPCYNQAHFLNDTLQSVIDQNYGQWECIIVNDGSPDNTEEIAMDWCKKDARFNYVYKENAGLPSARNTGIESASGQYIVVLDSDDILHKNFLQRLYQELESNDGISIVSCYRLFFQGDVDRVVNTHEPKGEGIESLLYENILMPSSMYRKEVWDQVGGYDESMVKGFEDWEFWVSATKNGSRFKILPEYLFYYRKSKRSMLTDTLQNHLEDNMKYVFKKHREIYIEKFDVTLDYLMFLVKKHRVKEQRLQNSVEYRLGKLLTKPFRTIKNWFKRSKY